MLSTFIMLILYNFYHFIYEIFVRLYYKTVCCCCCCCCFFMVKTSQNKISRRSKVRFFEKAGVLLLFCLKCWNKETRPVIKI